MQPEDISGKFLAEHEAGAAGQVAEPSRASLQNLGVVEQHAAARRTADARDEKGKEAQLEALDASTTSTTSANVCCCQAGSAAGGDI